MIYCKELNKNFDTPEQMFKALWAEKDQIISRKKAQIFKSCQKGTSIVARPIDPSKINGATKGMFSDDDYYYVAVNSIYILDSHKDLHLPGIWNRTVKQQQGKNYLVLDHVLSIETTVVKKEYITMFVATIPWSMLGKSYEGNTEALIYKFKKEKVINPKAKEWLESGDDIEASVRMQYVDIMFAVNSNDKEYVREKKNYDEYIGLVANKDEFEDEIRYFWPVKEAKNTGESSLVLFGSNGATGVVSEKSDALTKCESCDLEFKYDTVNEEGMGYVKCPSCKELINQEGIKVDSPDGTQHKDTDSPDGTQKKLVITILNN